MIAAPGRRLLVQRSLAFAWTLAAVVAAVPAGALADGDCVAEVVDRVQAHYDGVRDLRGRFEQRTERASLGGAPSDALVAKGEVVFAKPGKMRWTYEAPEPSVVVSDGDVLWIYDEKAREVQKLALGQGHLSAAGVQFLLGAGKLREEFAAAAKDCAAPVVSLALVPRRDVAYESLELRVDRATGIVRETTVVDLFGNRTRVTFDRLRENSDPDASLFRFAAPEGVRVIEVPASP